MMPEADAVTAAYVTATKVLRGCRRTVQGRSLQQTFNRFPHETSEQASDTACCASEVGSGQVQALEAVPYVRCQK
jgi:hypothetical protein